MLEASRAFSRTRGGWLRAAWTRKRSRPVPNVIIHDPAAACPHDLDDPYFDPKIQNRFADLIARAASKEQH
jgi:hypothetical protein